MTYLFGSLAAHPMPGRETQSRLASARDDLMLLLNERIKPPAPLAFDQVHIRALRLVSDQVNDHGGRFPREEHARLCELVLDSPVLVGHDRSRLPVARNFAARCVDEAESGWVEVWFYWMRGDGDHHDDLALDIDAGVVKEGSIGFEFASPQCSICAQDIRSCDHIPGFEYDGVTAHYEYRGLVRVLETSLVYRGATPETRIVKYPLFEKLQKRRLTCSFDGGLTQEDAQHHKIQQKSREFTPSPLPPGEVVAERRWVRETQQERTTDSPAVLRPAPSRVEGAHLATRSFHCPARTVPWPRFALDYKAGHGPLARKITS